MNYRKILKLVKDGVKINLMKNKTKSTKEEKQNPVKLFKKYDRLKVFRDNKYFFDALKKMPEMNKSVITPNVENNEKKQTKKTKKSLLNKNILVGEKHRRVYKKFKLIKYKPKWFKKNRQRVRNAKKNMYFKFYKHILKLKQFKNKNILTIHIRCTRNNTFIVATKRNYILNKKSKRKKLKILKRNNESNIFLNKIRKKRIIHVFKKRALKMLKPYVTRSSIVAWSSSGTSGFKGNKKGLPYAAQTAATILGIKIKNKKYKKIRGVRIKIRGRGKGRFNVIKGLRIALRYRIPMLSLEKIRANPHNGCRKKKKRRV